MHGAQVLIAGVLRAALGITDGEPAHVRFDIGAARGEVKHPSTNGFVERFYRTVKEEFFETAMRESFYESVDALQANLDRWLIHYNIERPHLGYRNLGKRPIDTVNAYLTSIEQDAS